VQNMPKEEMRMPIRIITSGWAYGTLLSWHKYRGMHDDEHDYVQLFALLDWGRMPEKRGFSIGWVRDEHGELDIYGRALLGVWTYYDSTVIDLLFLRIVFT